MPFIKHSCLLFIGFSLYLLAEAQVSDSSSTLPPITGMSKSNRYLNMKAENQHLHLKPFIIPATLFLYGLGSIKNDGLQHINTELKDEVYAEHPHRQIHLDNYLQFAPAAAVYALNLSGIKGKHNLADRSIIYLMSNIILNITVASVKKISHEMRPDGSDHFSFPSGHTAEAFASAEFLYQEYKDRYPWPGVAGYSMATATGYLRMYNNKHWFGDVVAGAGIGIVSTKLAYWLYPKIQHKLWKRKFCVYSKLSHCFASCGR